MIQADLTPSQFTKRMQTRAAVRRWVVPLIACGVLAMGCIVMASSQSADTSGQLAEERLLQAQLRVESGEKMMASKKGLLAQRQRELQAEQHLTLRPDWAGVLTLVGRQFDAQLMMTGFELGEAGDNRIRGALGALATDTPSESVWLILRGVAEANSNVPGLIMRLEKLGLFDRVVMTGSQREAFAGGSRTTFTLACKVQ